VEPPSAIALPGRSQIGVAPLRIATDRASVLVIGSAVQHVGCGTQRPRQPLLSPLRAARIFARDELGAPTRRPLNRDLARNALSASDCSTNTRTAPCNFWQSSRINLGFCGHAYHCRRRGFDGRQFLCGWARTPRTRFRDPGLTHLVWQHRDPERANGNCSPI
jgi:hypothetical protein